MVEAELDALLIASPHNFCYFAGPHLVISQNLLHRFHFAVIPLKGDPTLIVSEPESWVVREETWISDIRTYEGLLRPWSRGESHVESTPTGKAQSTPLELLADVLSEKGLLQARIGFEASWLPSYYLGVFEKFLPDARLVDCSRLVKEAQRLRTPEEVELLRHANLSMAKAMHVAYESAMVGDTELEVAANMVRYMVKAGLQPRTFTMGSGPQRGRRGHPWPSSKRLEPGDLIHADPKGTYKGYHGDVVRMAIVGKPTRTQLKTYESLRSIHLSTIEACRPGITCGALYEHCRQAFEREGLKMHMSLIGHGLGSDQGHDPHVGDVSIVAGSDMRLEPGMVFTIEPILDTEDGRWHMEDAIHMTEGGPEVLSDHPTGGQYLHVIDG